MREGKGGTDENISSKGGDAHDLKTSYSQVNDICFIFRIIFSTEEPKKSESVGGKRDVTMVN